MEKKPIGIEETNKAAFGWFTNSNLFIILGNVCLQIKIGVMNHNMLKPQTWLNWF